MSIADYSDLLGQCAEYTGRDDFAHMFPRFVSFAESKLNRALRVGKMEAMAVLTTDVYGGVEMPADFLEVRQVSNTKGEPLKGMTPEYLDHRYRFTAGTAEGYCIIGGTMYVVPVEQAAQFTVTYYAKIEPLTVSNTSNWLLVDSPLAYLYAVCAEITGWALATGKETDASKLQGFNQALQAEIASYEALDRSRRFSNMIVQPRGVNP